MVPPRRLSGLRGRGKIPSDRNVDAKRRQIGEDKRMEEVFKFMGEKNDTSPSSDRRDSCGMSECNLGSVNHEVANSLRGTTSITILQKIRMFVTW